MNKAMSSGDSPHRRRSFSARDRVLLYLSGMNVDEVTGLELAAECLRRTGQDSKPERVMLVLNELLQEKGVVFKLRDSARRIRSFPPLNRKTMVSERINCLTLYGSAKSLFLRVLGGGRRRRRA